MTAESHRNPDATEPAWLSIIKPKTEEEAGRVREQVRSIRARLGIAYPEDRPGPAGMITPDDHAERGRAIARLDTWRGHMTADLTETGGMQ